MIVNYSAQQIREQVSPVELLAKLGHQPAYKSGKEFFYLSMLREERTASLCVDDKLGVWYDHGGPNPSGIKGGNVIDLGLAYWYPSGFREVLEKINQVCSLDLVSDSPITKEHCRPRRATRIPNYKILEVKSLGNNPAITSYLQQRGIWPVAHEYLKEVYYFVEDEKKLRKYFFSAGWQNENGGWEVSNPYFKGCLGAKGLTLIPGDGSRIALFEGMTDFLTWKFEEMDCGETAIILNGVTFIEAAIKRSSAYDEKSCFFDHDEAGESALEAFKNVYPNAINGSDVYEGFKDFNEKLVFDLAKLSHDPVLGIISQVKFGAHR